MYHRQLTANRFYRHVLDAQYTQGDNASGDLTLLLTAVQVCPKTLAMPDAFQLIVGTCRTGHLQVHCIQCPKSTIDQPVSVYQHRLEVPD